MRDPGREGFFEPHPTGSTDMIRNADAIFRQKGLLPVQFGDFISPFCEHGPDIPEGILIKDQAGIEKFAESGFCDIIPGGTDAA